MSQIVNLNHLKSLFSYQKFLKEKVRFQLKSALKKTLLNNNQIICCMKNNKLSNSLPNFNSQTGEIIQKFKIYSLKYTALFRINKLIQQILILINLHNWNTKIYTCYVQKLKSISPTIQDQFNYYLLQNYIVMRITKVAQPKYLLEKVKPQQQLCLQFCCVKEKVNVDIVTSSPVLAIRDAQELASFYKLFSISVAHNINGSQNQKLKMFPCYESQVIYGDPHSFQADILRHEYSELGTMGSRQQGYIIVDEVDSMLIDGNSNKTLLSTPIPGMLDLTKVLRLIWDEICKSLPNLSTDKKL